MPTSLLCPGSSGFAVFMAKAGAAISNIARIASPAEKAVSISAHALQVAGTVGSVIAFNDEINNHFTDAGVGKNIDITGPGDPIAKKSKKLSWSERIKFQIALLLYKLGSRLQANMVQPDDPPLVKFNKVTNQVTSGLLMLDGAVGMTNPLSEEVGESESVSMDESEVGAAELGVEAVEVPVVNATEKVIANRGSALVETANKILKPGGNIIGRAGSNASIRELSGGLEAAQSYWNRLVTSGARRVLGSSYKGILMELPNGGTVGFRTMMTRSPGTAATIDVNIPGLFQGKLKFNP